ncbi:MAG: exosortase E/protease, VPEID-CTERM system [Acidobacteriota bacterium]
MNALPQLSDSIHPSLEGGLRTTLIQLVQRHPEAVRRFGLLAGLLLVELLVVTIWLDGASLSGRAGLPGEIGVAGAWVLRFLVGIAAAFVAFASMQGTLEIDAFLIQTNPAPGRFFAGHVVFGAIFGVLSAALYGNWPGVTQPNTLAIAWAFSGLLSGASLCLAFYQLTAWTGLIRRSGAILVYAGVVALMGCVAVGLSQSTWRYAARLTFQLVQILLKPIVEGLTADPAALIIRGKHFGVVISQECSGLEGMGLMLVFSVVWLWLFRRDFRFPRAYLLVPIGIITLYLLNAVRIAALLLIGDAGFRKIAAGGFHSQAGWIAFNGVALAMTVVVPRMGWFSVRPLEGRVEDKAEARLQSKGDNPATFYLLPFLVILASGMFSRAASADFDWFYALRFFAAAVTLWLFRDQLRQLDWRISPWLGPVAGIAVFVVWLGFDQWQGIPSAAMPKQLAAAGRLPALVWMALRALAATTTVPIAEELAFRGFLPRRLMSVDFQSISLQQISWWSLVGSSIAFGLLHGERWMAGILAGLVYACVIRRTGRIGDAVIAHAVTNGLLAFWVLYLDQWQYW